MKRDTIAQILGFGAFASFLLIAGSVFLNTGSKVAGLLILGSPLLVLAGVFMYRRAFSISRRKSQTGQLKHHQLQEFLESLKEAESRVAAADAYFEGRLRDLPDIGSFASELDGVFRRAKNGEWQIRSGKADSIRLADVERVGRELERTRQQIDSQIQGAMEIAVEEWAPEVRKLIQVGLSPIPLNLDGIEDGDINSLLSRVYSLANHSLDELQSTISFVANLYGEASSEQAELQAVRQLLDQDAVVEGLSKTVGLANSLAARIQKDFDGHRRVLVQVIGALDKIPRDDGFLPIHTLEKVEKVCKEVLSLNSPLQFPRLDQLRSELVMAADSAIREFRSHLEYADPDAAAEFASEYEAPLRPPADMHDFDEYAISWIERFNKLTVAIKDIKQRNSKEALFQRFEPKMEALLKQRGELDLSMLKLKENSILKWFAERHPEWVVDGDSLVAVSSMNAPSKDHNRTKRKA